MPPEVVFTALAAFATAIGLGQWGPGLVQHLTGRATREKERVQAEIAKTRAAQTAELDRAHQELYQERQEHRAEVARLRQEHEEREREADVQACQRRMLQEYVMELRRQLLGVGEKPAQYPDLTKCKENP